MFYGVGILKQCTSGYSCETVHYRKSEISIFPQFFASIGKIFILGVRLGVRYTSMGLSDFPHIS